jgi:hypothetical protein
MLELSQAQASTGMKRMKKTKQKTKRTENREQIKSQGYE